MTQEQAKNLTFPCKVRVMNAGQPSYWYSGAIGCVFTAVRFGTYKNILIVKRKTIVGFGAIDISDCELYEEPKEVKTQLDEQTEKAKLSPDEIYQAWKDGKGVKFHSDKVIDMQKMVNGTIAFVVENQFFETIGHCNYANVCSFTIEEPVEAMFTPVYGQNDKFFCDADYNTLAEAKEVCTHLTTCILEHHKINGKWVFVKAHKID